MFRSKSIRTKSMLVVSRKWGGGGQRKGSDWLVDTEVLL